MTKFNAIPQVFTDAHGSFVSVKDPETDKEYSRDASKFKALRPALVLPKKIVIPPVIVQNKQLLVATQPLTVSPATSPTVPVTIRIRSRVTKSIDRFIAEPESGLKSRQSSIQLKKREDDIARKYGSVTRK
jgi:hypothetical protein